MRKYYTPEIEEFHVGFEYESIPKRSTMVDFMRFKYAGNNSMIREFEVSDLRVKRLDREDIESLGFSQSNLSDSVFLYKEKVCLLPHLPKTTVGLNFNEGIPHVLIYYVPDEKAVPAGVNLFVGKIKNKSELKRLLKQLGIWYHR